MGKADINRVKNFLSSSVDDFRPPYLQSTFRAPRYCVFAGTVNPGAMGYLKDETGNRRFWPIRCGIARAVDLKALERERDLLWAATKLLFESGARWWPETPAEKGLCGAEQAARLQLDPWQGAVEEYLATRMPRARVTIREILSTKLGVELGKQDKTHQTRVRVCLHLAGWVAERRDRNECGLRERLYARQADLNQERLEGGVEDASGAT